MVRLVRYHKRVTVTRHFMKRKKISAYLDPQLEELAKRSAKRRNMSLSTLIGWLVSKQIENDRKSDGADIQS